MMIIILINLPTWILLARSRTEAAQVERVRDIEGALAEIKRGVRLYVIHNM